MVAHLKTSTNDKRSGGAAAPQSPRGRKLLRGAATGADHLGDVVSMVILQLPPQSGPAAQRAAAGRDGAGADRAGTLPDRHGTGDDICLPSMSRGGVASRDGRQL